MCLPGDILFSAFEAARWAPSANNAQPWRFVYVKRGWHDWERFLGLLNERNQLWASRASALVLVLSLKQRDAPEGIKTIRSHSFDAGAAWSAFAHQLAQQGWSTRAIGGYSIDATRSLLGVPEHFHTEAFIAVGKPTNEDVLNEELKALEKPTQRLPISRIVSEGSFTFND